MISTSWIGPLFTAVAWFSGTIVTTLMEAPVAPRNAPPCESLGCAIDGDSSPPPPAGASVDFTWPPNMEDHEGSCRCDPTCTFESNCGLTLTVTFRAGAGNVLCRDTMSFGETEEKTLTVDSCGDQDQEQFTVRVGNCDGALVGHGQLVWTLSCFDCDWGC